MCGERRGACRPARHRTVDDRRRQTRTASPSPRFETGLSIRPHSLRQRTYESVRTISRRAGRATSATQRTLDGLSRRQQATCAPVRAEGEDTWARTGCPASRMLEPRARPPTSRKLESKVRGPPARFFARRARRAHGCSTKRVRRCCLELSLVVAVQADGSPKP